MSKPENEKDQPLWKQFRGNDLVKRLLEARPHGTSTLAFYFEWNGTRVPEQITFPDDSKRKVGYMRDGILQFRDEDGKSTDGATYERVLDYVKDSDNPGIIKNSIVVYYKINNPAVCN